MGVGLEGVAGVLDQQQIRGVACGIEHPRMGGRYAFVLFAVYDQPGHAQHFGGPHDVQPVLVGLHVLPNLRPIGICWPVRAFGMKTVSPRCHASTCSSVQRSTAAMAAQVTSASTRGSSLASRIAAARVAEEADRARAPGE